MKREVTQEIRLAAFTLTIGDLELLWARLFELFEKSSKVEAYFSISIPSEKIRFDSVEEFKNYTGLKGVIPDFNLRMSQSGRSVSISRGGAFFGNAFALRVVADSDVWCAGAVGAAMRVIREARVWYWWFVRIPFGTLGAGWLAMPWLKFGPFENYPGGTSGQLMIAWALILFLLTYLFAMKSQLMPQASITISEERGFFRRYLSEFSLIAGTALSILLWIFPYETPSGTRAAEGSKVVPAAKAQSSPDGQPK